MEIGMWISEDGRINIIALPEPTDMALMDHLDSET